mmetsp:Transcript_13214/g.44165  ORF Transcript_13214/g.44165 Transcript_13214/m.44165 type:complete len:203 (-) Transcript_13214:683-1291(-)
MSEAKSVRPSAESVTNTVWAPGMANCKRMMKRSSLDKPSVPRRRTKCATERPMVGTNTRRARTNQAINLRPCLRDRGAATESRGCASFARAAAREPCQSDAAMTKVVAQTRGSPSVCNAAPTGRSQEAWPSRKSAAESGETPSATPAKRPIMFGCSAARRAYSANVRRLFGADSSPSIERRSPFAAAAASAAAARSRCGRWS